MGTLIEAAVLVPRPLRARCDGGYSADRTTSMLPAALARVWAGGGRRVATNTQAGLQVHARWERTRGRLAVLPLAAARERDQAAERAAPALPTGALRLSALGAGTRQR